HWSHNGPAGRPPTNVNRRFALRTLAQSAIAVPLARRGFAAPADVEIQPLLAHVRRIFDAMRYLGEPFSDADLARFAAIEDAKGEAAIRDAVDALLAPRCLAEIRINPETRVSVARGPADPRLVEQGWRAYLVKVRNQA